MLGDDLTCRMRNVDPSRDRQMCPRDVATRLHCLLPPKIAPTPDMYHTMLFNTPVLTGHEYTRVFMQTLLTGHEYTRICTNA